jgi:hypothetical protein
MFRRLSQLRTTVPLMSRIAKWRGKPNATTYPEALQIFELANLSKKDIFYDVGCGHGWVCI